MEEETTTTTAPSSTLSIPSSDILRLILSHLTESGLHGSVAALRHECGAIGLAGLSTAAKSRVVAAAEDGRWGEVIQGLEGLDLNRDREERRRRRRQRDEVGHAGGDDGDGAGGAEGDDAAGIGDGDEGEDTPTPLERAVAAAHEATILELADAGEVDLAHASLRLSSSFLDRCLPLESESEDHHGGASDPTGAVSTRSGDIERRIAALVSLRASSVAAAVANSTERTLLLPADYYGPQNLSRRRKRERVARMLRKDVPEVPAKRLTCLLQQSVRWQFATGLFPTVERLFRGDDEEEEVEEEENDGGDGKKKKSKKRKKPRAEKRFDLVLGNVDLPTAQSSSDDGRKKRRSSSAAERIPERITQTIRLGKRSYVESALFLPDGKGLVTGSSDGFIEIWGEPKSSSSGKDADSGNNGEKHNSSKENGEDDALKALLHRKIDYEKLRTSDLPYQKSDDLLSHDSAILAMDISKDGTLLGSASSDGTVCVWKLSDGKLLRRLERAHGGGGSGKGAAAVSCLRFAPDGSKVLTGGYDGTCREFGLLASRMLKEFRGHDSYINCCGYVLLPGGDGGGNHTLLRVVTASADGTVRIWDGRTAEPLRVISPPGAVAPPPTPSGNATGGVTLPIVDTDPAAAGSKSVHTVVHMHSPPHTMIVVPRSDRAYLMTYTGAVLKTYVRDDVQGTEFLAAAVSPSNRWLCVATDDGVCAVFDVHSGRMEKVMRSFAEGSCGGTGSGGSKRCEITGLVYHPHWGMLGGYSNDKGQKRGLLTLWK